MQNPKTKVTETIADPNNPGNGTTKRITEFDYNCNGTPEWIHVAYLFGGRLDAISYRQDFDEDGTVDRTYNYYYGEGREIVRTIDYDADGNFDYVVHSTYNDKGQRVLERIDSDGDGPIDQHRYISYNERGQVTREATDLNLDGKVDDIIAVYYNERGDFTRIEYDTDANGTPERVELNAYGDEVTIQTDSHQLLLTYSTVEFLDQDNDDSMDLLRLGGKADFTIDAAPVQEDPPTGMRLTGLDNIQMSHYSSSELTLTAESVQSIANGDTSHEIMVKGGADDTVNLQNSVQPDGEVLGTFAIRDDNDDGTVDTKEVAGKTYEIYDAHGAQANTVVGSVLIEQEVTVVLPE